MSTHAVNSHAGRVYDLAALATSLDAAVTAGGACLDPDGVVAAREVMERGLQRLELGAQHTVVALVGATGSGKSTLFNALAEMEIAEVGARRPLTKEPMACIWGEDGSTGLLDWLAVPESRRLRRESVLDADRQAPLHGLVLLDLPDHDSTEVSHRFEVDRLVGKVDLLVWVVDPQKYADDALHSRYLQQLTDHETVMVVVLNQVDKLRPEEIEQCLADLRRLLVADGLPAIRLLAVSARSRYGVEDLRNLIVDAVRTRTAVIDRSSADLVAVTHRLRAGVADREPGDGGPLPGTEALTNELSDAAGVPAVLDAITGEYRRRGAQYGRWLVGRMVQGLRSDAVGRLGGQVDQDDLQVIVNTLQPFAAPTQRAQVQVAVDSFASSIAAELPPRWGAAVRNSVRGATENLVHELDSAVSQVDLQIDTPWRWRFLRLAQWALALVALAGAAWLFATGAYQLAGRYLPYPPEFGGVPLPVILLGAGLLLGALIAPLGGWSVKRRAIEYRDAVDRRLHDVVAKVARELVVEPVDAVLARHRTVRQALNGELQIVQPELTTAMEAAVTVPTPEPVVAPTPKSEPKSAPEVGGPVAAEIPQPEPLVAPETVVEAESVGVAAAEEAPEVTAPVAAEPVAAEPVAAEPVAQEPAGQPETATAEPDEPLGGPSEQAPEPVAQSEADLEVSSSEPVAGEQRVIRLPDDDDLDLGVVDPEPRPEPVAEQPAEDSGDSRVAV
ncbi:GTPase [Spongisporangium articulatum]|uniref:GTPase n=1 Tax=Spongisporangium articulatum TaxID=3362603 RepID=A0ABW8AKD5_9ACTN